jgi:NHL repeat
MALALLAAAPAGAAAAEGPKPLWQRCDGGPEDLPCSIARGVAVNPSAGNVYVSDGANTTDRVVEFNPWGQFIRAWGWGVKDGSAEFQICTEAATCNSSIGGGGAGQFSGSIGPQGIAVDASGNVYVVDFSNLRVQKFDSEGHFLVMFGGKVNKTKVEAAAPEAEQNRCPVSPGDVCQAGTSGNGNSQFAWSNVVGSFVAVGPAPNNLVYVGDQGRVQVFNSNGAYKENFPDPEGLIAPNTVKALAPAPGNGLYLAFNEKADALRLTSAGKLSCTAKVPTPKALAMATTASGSPTGNLYVFDQSATTQIRQFTAGCADKEAPFATGDVASSTGIAVGAACLTGEADVYLSQNTSPSILRAYGPPPTKPACPKPVYAPEVTSEFAVSVDTEAALLRAQINPRFYADTTYYVRYGTAACVDGGGWEAACVEERPAAPGVALGAEAVDFPFTSAGVFLSGLSPATTYRYRFVVQSVGGGPVQGEAKSFTTFASPAGIPPCPNQEFRSGAAAFLPDCRAYEMVSPVDKEGGDILTLEDFNGKFASITQSATSGDRFTYSTFRSFGDAQSAPYSSQYIASRQAGSGWSSHGISPPRGTAVSAGDNQIPGFKREFEAFSPDLCNGWLVHDNTTAPPLAPGGAELNNDLYRRSNCGADEDSYSALAKTSPPTQLQGVSADGSEAVFRTQLNLTQDAAIAAGSQLGCAVPVQPASGVSLSFQWLRNGAPIGGATGSAYTVKAEDAGKAVQCRLTAGGAGDGSTQVANPAAVVAPYPATAPPLAPSGIAAPTASGPLAVGGAGGQTLSCDSGEAGWEGASSFEYRWYRNGAAIAGAEAPSYEVSAGDLATPSAFQCEAIGVSVGGKVALVSASLPSSPAPATPPARPNMNFKLGFSEVVYLSHGAGGLRSVCILPGGTASIGCSAGTVGGPPSGRADQVAHALSEDGSRLYWTNSTEGAGSIYLRENPSAPQSALALGEATGAGDLSNGADEVSGLSTASGAFAVGQRITAEASGFPSAAIPPGTTIAAISPSTLTLSAAATETIAGVTLRATSDCTEAAKACTIGVSEGVEGKSHSRFWAAAKDGSAAIFTSGEGLFEFDAEEGAAQPIAHEVLGVVGAGEDLSRIYFVSKEALTGEGEGEGNSEGAFAVAGKPNLYLYRAEEGGSFAFVGTLAAADVDLQRQSPVAIEPYRHIARVSADGESAAFMATARLSGYDNTDLASGKADGEVYHYSAANGQLECVSCNPSGGRPRGRELVEGNGFGQGIWAAAYLPFIEGQLYASHVLSENGSRLLFQSYDSLVLADTNGKQDVYEWEAVGSGTCSKESAAFSANGGCLSLISSGQSPQDSSLLDASPAGEDVFFTTGTSLLPIDPGSIDVYDARAGGGFPLPAPPQPPCEGEACQSPPAPPAEVTPSSSVFQGPGNPAKKHKHKHAKKHKKQRGHGKSGRAGR